MNNKKAGFISISSGVINMLTTCGFVSCECICIVEKGKNIFKYLFFNDKGTINIFSFTSMYTSNMNEHIP